MKNLILYENFSINESESPRKLVLFHGVKIKGGADDILKNGFDLKKINPIWTNDYAISTMTTSKSVSNFFGKNVPIIKIEFFGVVATPRDTNFISAKTPQDYTKQLVDSGIDAVMLDGSGARQVFIYNTAAIKKVTLL